MEFDSQTESPTERVFSSQSLVQIGGKFGSTGAFDDCKSNVKEAK